MHHVTIHDLVLYPETETGPQARFFCVADGWTIHGLQVTKKNDGFLAVYGPRCRTRATDMRRAVEPPRDVWMAIVHAALAEYARRRDSEGAVNEALEMAGI